MSNLLDKRYLVIAEDISERFKVGEVLNYDFYDTWIENVPKRIYFYKFPHLFRELQWWEMREESEMPEYVKWNPESILYKNQTPVYKTKISDKEWNEVSKHCNIHLSHLIPATPEEYSEYIKSK